MKPVSASITVAICTHNPRLDFLSRASEALRCQSLPQEDWDLAVIDNASDPAIQKDIFAWSHNVRIIRENRLGLTPARLAAIAAARTDLIVFVDDDNSLDSRYLEHCQRIAIEYPRLGAWGGQCLPDFIDGAPQDWTRPYWHYIAVSSLDGDYWTSRNINDGRFIPCGAGLVVRKDVANAYAHGIMNSPVRFSLDRRGTDLASCGDTDLALTACDLGYGIGRFACLQLTHSIPGQRLSEEYLARIIEAIECSAKVLKSLRAPVEREPRYLVRKLRLFAKLLLGRCTLRDYNMSLAQARGRTRADAILTPLVSQTPDGLPAIAGARN